MQGPGKRRECKCAEQMWQMPHDESFLVGLILRMRVACCALARSEVGHTGLCRVRRNIASGANDFKYRNEVEREEGRSLDREKPT